MLATFIKPLKPCAKAFVLITVTGPTRSSPSPSGPLCTAGTVIFVSVQYPKLVRAQLPGTPSDPSCHSYCKSREYSGGHALLFWV